MSKIQTFPQKWIKLIDLDQMNTDTQGYFNFSGI